MNTMLSEKGIERLEKVMSHVIVCLEELQKDAYLDRPPMPPHPVCITDGEKPKED